MPTHLKNKNTYQLIDSGQGKKFERVGDYYLVRPCANALWSPKLNHWDHVDAEFSRKNTNQWSVNTNLPTSWQINYQGLNLELRKTNFGHLGIFAEHGFFCACLDEAVKNETKVLNLFAYTGLLTVYTAKKGAKVCHVDASKTSVEWAKKNAKLNNLENASIRWIVDDVMKFVKREVKRASKYDVIILDPPTFGRGSQGQVFKIEDDLVSLLMLLKSLLCESKSLIILSCHTPGITPIVLSQVFEQTFKVKSKADELLLIAEKGYNIPSGCYAIWKK
jgi:23S rRNA (cytosine1962-C5)-methyltransferase